MNRFPVSSMLLFVLLWAMIDCNGKRNQADTVRLMKVDSVLQQHPKQAADSLKKINFKKLSGYNRGYYSLLDVVSKDKTYYTFTSDSQINASVHLLSKYKTKEPRTYARSLMYKGIVRYRMGITDSTAYQPIREAVNIIEKNNVKDIHTLLFCYNYLGLIDDENDNLNGSVEYLNKAIEMAKRLANKAYLFNAYKDLFWVYMKKNDLNGAKQCVDKLNGFQSLSEDQTADRNIVLAQYFEKTKEYVKSLKINMQLYKQSIADNKSPYLPTLYRLSKNYYELHQLDSALYFAEMAEKNITDTTNHSNYFYYENIGKIAEGLQLWRKSAIAFKKGYELKDKALEKELDTKILELEKKYDLTQAENKALMYKNRTILLGAICFLLLLLSVAGVYLRLQFKKQAALKLQLVEQQKNRMEHDLITKEFMLPIYRQISRQNAKVKTALADLKTNTSISMHPDLAQKIARTYDDFIQSADINPENFLSDESFKMFTGLGHEVCELLTDSEKMLLTFMSLELDNKEIAVLFNTSESGIRGRKTKLRSKLQRLNIVYDHFSS